MNEAILEIYSQILNLLQYMVPHSFKDLKLYCSIREKSNKDYVGNNKNNIRSEMYFYYIKKGDIFNKYINSYSIPKEYGIDEIEYMDLIYRLYNLFVELKYEMKKVNRDFNEIIFEINTKKNNLKVEYFKDREELSSYIRHILFRYLKLNIFPYDINDQKILKQYFKSEMYKKVYIKEEYNVRLNESNSIIDYYREKTLEEVLENTKERKNNRKLKITKNNEEEKIW